MGFIKGFFKKDFAEKLLKDAGCDLRKIKKLLSSAGYGFVLDHIRNLGQQVTCKKSPVEIVTPAGTFQIPLIIRSEEGYTAFLPPLKSKDEEAIQEILILIGFIKKSIYFDIKIVIAEKAKQSSILQFFTSRLPLAGFFLLLFVDFQIVKQGKDPGLIFIENFYKAFQVNLECDSKSLKLLDEHLSINRRLTCREVLICEPVSVMKEILHNYLVKVFQSSLHASQVESGKVKTGKTYFSFKFMIIVMDFEGKIEHDLRHSGKFSFYLFFEDAKVMSEDPRALPHKENLPFLEWKIITEQIRYLARPLPLKEALEVIMDYRHSEIQEIGPQVGDGWIDLYFCQHCDVIEPRYHRFQDLRFHSLKEMKLFMLSQISYGRSGGGSGEICTKCGREYPWNHLVFSKFQHYFSDLKMDLQLHYDRLPTGHHFYLWQAMNENKIRRRLSTDFTDQDFFAYFHRHASVAIVYNKLLEKTLKTRKAEKEEIEDGYHIFTIPPVEDDNPNMRTALKELISPLKKSGRNYQTYNLNVPGKKGKIRVKDGFSKWAPDFRKHLIVEGYQLLAFIDVDLIIQKFEEKLIDPGIIFHLEDETCYMDKGKYRFYFDFYEKIREMADTAQYLSDFVESHIGGFIKKFDRVGSLHSWIIDNYGKKLEFEFDREKGLLSITNPENQIKTPFNLYDSIDRIEPGNPLLTEIFEHSVLKGLPHPNLCSCGSPSNMIIRLVSKEKLNEIKQSLPEGEEPVTMNYGKKYYIFKSGCLKHSTYLTVKQMQEMELTNQLILKQVMEDVNNDEFRIDIYMTEYKNKEYIGITGKDAATLGADGGRVKQVLSLCYPSHLEDRVTVYTDLMDALILTESDSSGNEITEFARIFYKKKKEALKNPLPIHLFLELALPQIGVGKIIINNFEEDFRTF
ncbi:MAG: hypothetical protein K8T10_07995 [Candidatus Eremiobacteraeota bacterium]|nr:hypothetical protein [Candidatus Eremiobacteraeota bacterium]